MAAIAKPEWVQLIHAQGEQYWRGELKRAQTSLVVYGVVLVVAIGLRFAIPDQSETAGFALLLPWVMMAGVTLYVGYSQSNLLPFMNAKPVTHWLGIGVLALLGCGGILWLVLFASNNKRAKDNLLAAIRASKVPPEQPVSPYPRG